MFVPKDNRIKNQHYNLKSNKNNTATGRWFIPVRLVFYTNKTDRHDITEILLKVALNTTKQTNKQINMFLLLQEDGIHIDMCCHIIS
jgi:hypothetical protein